MVKRVDMTGGGVVRGGEGRAVARWLWCSFAVSLAWWCPFLATATDDSEDAEAPAAVLALDEAVVAAIARVAVDEEEADFLRERLTGMAATDAQQVLDELARHPQFDAAAAQREFDQDMPPPAVKYSAKVLVEVKAAADELFTPYRKGDVITVPIVFGAGISREFTGEYQGLFEDKRISDGTIGSRRAKIGGRFFLLRDLPGEVRDRFDEELMTDLHHEHLQNHYHRPKELYEAAYHNLLERHLAQRRDSDRDARRQLVRARIAALSPVQEHGDNDASVTAE